jgi:demethylmenaquinone methyltransferase/2-methoxy-6-polyprenyl-1,4-benzoquinol methylase
MIEAAQAKSSQVEWVCGDALALPFADGEFDAATVGFGVRNLPDIERGFREMARVVRGGGRVVCLELTEPPRLVAPFARLWTDRAVPLLGRLIARETDAYRYLPASVHRFPPADELAEIMRAAGLAPGGSAIDVCCGTGDMAIELLDVVSTRGRVVGLDFSERMIDAAQAKSSQVEWVRGDALALPFADGEFDAATVGFGVRNLPDIERGFREMARVVRGGGRVVCLELTEPPRLVAPFARLWTDRAVPLLGRLIARETDAYRYLPASVHRFPPADELAEIMRAAGLERVAYKRLSGGAVALHAGTVPA